MLFSCFFFFVSNSNIYKLLYFCFIKKKDMHFSVNYFTQELGNISFSISLLVDST